MLSDFGFSDINLRFALSILRGFLSNEKIEGVKGLSLTANGMGVVFDVPADDVNAFTAGMLNVPFRNSVLCITCATESLE